MAKHPTKKSDTPPSVWQRLKDQEGTINLGDIVRCKITGYKGVAIARTEWLNNCPAFTVQPRETKDGKPVEAKAFDELGLEFVEKSDVPVTPADRPKEKIELEDYVEDRITGLRGVVIGRTTWLNGCSRVYVKPRELKDGLPVDGTTIDEKEVVLLERPGQEIKRPMAKTGGPRPEVSRTR